MLYQPIFGDRALTESLYRTLIHRFHDSLNLSLQTLLNECTLGFAPSPDGVKTFFIVAPSLEIAEQLIEDIDSLVNQVATLMVGVRILAICLNPSKNYQQPNATNNARKFTPEYIACKFFSIPLEYEMADD
ncbi:hypothetical protein BCD67_05590 [Oscillatoriales cyanobacterium USR001]|nr:hypothetical protein BCD67_05590 [Oscillatoriales cyanobacterium USR001]